MIYLTSLDFLLLTIKIRKPNRKTHLIIFPISESYSKVGNVGGRKIKLIRYLPSSIVGYLSRYIYTNAQVYQRRHPGGLRHWTGCTIVAS